MAILKLNNVNAITEASGAVTFVNAGGVRSRQIFTASGQWNKPPGITTIKVQVQGSGGGGGKWQNPGGAGGYGEKLIDVTNISSETVTVGEAGAGAVNATEIGGTVNFGNHISATGGQARHGTENNNPGRGGNCAGGDINMKGGGGTTSHDGGSQLASAGGASFFGGGPPGRYNTVPGDGNTDGGAYGAGGASADGSGDGGNGVKGVVIVEEYS